MVKKIMLLSCAVVGVGLGINLMAAQEEGVEQERSQKVEEQGSDERQGTDWARHLNDWWIGPDGKKQRITKEELARKTQELTAKAEVVLENDGNLARVRAELAMTPEEAAEDYYQRVLERILPTMMELQESIRSHKCRENMPRATQTCAFALRMFERLAYQLNVVNKARVKTIQEANAAHNIAA